MGKGKEGFSGFGMSEKQIRKMQGDVAKKVDDNKEAIARELEEKKKASEFRDASEHAGMDKGDLGRSSRAKR